MSYDPTTRDFTAAQYYDIDTQLEIVNAELIKLQVVFGGGITGTIKKHVSIVTGESAAVTSVTHHKLLGIGDVTGTTAYGCGDPTKPTTGIMGCFGRTAIATAVLTDTAADFRIINKLTNTAANVIQGCYVKAKNYDTGTVGSVIGLFVEAVNDGTAAGGCFGIKIGKDSGTMTADMVFSNGLYLVCLTTAITANSTTTSAPAGSWGMTSHATGNTKLFVSDGSKWQYGAVA
jgi:hypothetical protein